MLKDNCSICTGKLKTTIMEPYCQNLFCGKCLLTWLEKNDNCPLCRANINTSDLVYLTDKEETTNVVISKEKQNTPLEKVIEILNSKKDGKFIIFSSYNETFKPICRRLKECSITFVVVVGNRKNREKSIDSFKHGETRVIFLNSNCNGAGINLQEATDIILYHKMTETTQNQIIGRANRIGRLECLNVHHLQVDI
jgi:SNF2 family DNA or RNA helicase